MMFGKVVAVGIILAGAGSAWAQDSGGSPLPAVPDLTTALPSLPGTGGTSGALLIHGNYCGPGNRGMDKTPIDALDAACRRHDACTPDGGALPRCACNARLVAESAAVAQDPNQTAELQLLAGNVSAAAQVLPCEGE